MTYTLKGFGPLISLLPYQFGFVPHGSFIVVLFQDAALEACLRIDADQVNGPPEELAEAFTDVWARRHINHAAVIAYDIPIPTEPGFALLQDALEAGLISANHFFEVKAGQWRTQWCEAQCCDDLWRPIDDPSGVAPVAEMVGRGVAPFSSREQASAALDRRDEKEQACLALTLASLKPDEDDADLNAGEACSWCLFLSGGAAGDTACFARCVRSLYRPHGRDTALRSVLPELTGHARRSCYVETTGVGETTGLGDGVDRHPKNPNFPYTCGEACGKQEPERALQSLLEGLAAIPEDLRATWLCLIALTRWRGGDYTGATLAARSAHDHDGQNSLALLCVKLLERQCPYDDFCQDPWPSPASSF